MSNFLSIFAFLPGALFVLWALLRVGSFLSDRWAYTSPSPRFYRFSTWVLRLALLIAGLDAMVFFSFMAWLAAAYGGSSSESSFVVGHASLAIYALLAFLLNFPGFPLHVHARFVSPVQLLLVPPLVVIVGNGMDFLFLALPLLMFAALWRWNLRDRVREAEDVFL